MFWKYALRHKHIVSIYIKAEKFEMLNITKAELNLPDAYKKERCRHILHT